MLRTQTATAALLACVVAACSGSQGTDADAPRSGAELPFTPMPRGNEVLDRVYLQADDAFQAGDFVAAQRDFGTIFILDPAYRGGLPGQAIVATCERIGSNCDLVFGRLEIMREVFFNRFGPIDSWVPQQRRDYFAIVECYERALVGDVSGAVAVGGPVTGSPDPTFAAYARRCADTANAAVTAAQRQRDADAALLVWFDNAPCMNHHRTQLVAAFNVGDWETFVNVYPQYAACADALGAIIERGVLTGDPRLGMEHDIAWSDMSEVDAIMEDHAATYEGVRRALTELASSPEYNRLGVEWNNLGFEEQRLRNQITSLETARDALTGNNRAQVEGQLLALEEQLVQVRRSRRDVMTEINRLRRDLGLQPRETP